MNPIFHQYLSEREKWQKAFDALLKYSSEAAFQPELLAAKEIFFSKLGRSHEMKQDLYEHSSVEKTMTLLPSTEFSI